MLHTLIGIHTRLLGSFPLTLSPPCHTLSLALIIIFPSFCHMCVCVRVHVHFYFVVHFIADISTVLCCFNFYLIETIICLSFTTLFVVSFVCACRWGCRCSRCYCICCHILLLHYINHHHHHHHHDHHYHCRRHHCRRRHYHQYNSTTF